jgi:hypothetical protein
MKGFERGKIVERGLIRRKEKQERGKGKEEAGLVD